MHPRQSSLVSSRVASLLTAILMFAGTAFAGTETVVHSFLGAPDGVSPNAGLVADAAGNLYGTTVRGGTNSSCSCGTVFELSPPATVGGSWTETILYSFQGGNNDGASPSGTLTFDKQGNLYGTTGLGGPGGDISAGTVFELSPPTTQGGAWRETVLLVFPSDWKGGHAPQGQLVFDAAGNLYGTTEGGGSKCDCGTVFELKAPATSGGAWAHIVLYNFGPYPSGDDGIQPGPDLIFRDGVIYGVTDSGSGTSQNGIVFQLVRKPGTWTETILHRFTGSEGSSPWGGLVMDSAGNLFGTTVIGGNTCPTRGCGVIYELSPPAVAGASWQETTLYNFTGHADGAYPYDRLWRDSLGDLFGTANQGGAKTCNIEGPICGTVFKLKAPAVSGGAWTLQVLHDFGGLPAGDGYYPLGQLTLVNGVFYGTTQSGGNQVSNGGTVFSVVP
jgi:uncharacterized repeat protein (TIGR03803 family)